MSLDNTFPDSYSPPAPPPPMKLVYYPEDTKKLLQVEGIVCVTAFLLPILVIVGSYRRRSDRWWIRFPLWAAYVGSTTLIANALGQMQSATFQDESFSFWAMFMLLVLGSADSICVYSLDESANQMRYYEEFVLQSLWVWWMISLYFKPSAKFFMRAKILAPLLALYVYAAMKAVERACVLMASSRSVGLVRDTKLKADFMGYEHKLSNILEVDPTCMKGYHYLVKGPGSITKKPTVIRPSYQKELDIKDDKVVTLQRVWECKGRLLNSQQGDREGRRKDVCLSYALFKILRCRFAGYDLPEYCSHSHEKTWRLVREGLIPKSNQPDEVDPERTFRVIETELAFLYDFFYTKYPVVTKLSYLLTLRPIEIVVVSVGCWAAASNLSASNLYYDGSISLYYDSKNIDVAVTYIVIAAILFTEAVQLFYIVFSDWVKLSCLRTYVRKPSWQSSKLAEKMIQLVCGITWKPWQRQLGQYSLLLSFDYNPLFSLAKSPLSLFMNVRRKGQRQSRRVKLCVKVKAAILRALKAYGNRPQQLTNGTTSLKRNSDKPELLKYCEEKKQTHVILVWHIATTLCEMHFKSQLSKKQYKELKSNDNFITATRLSKYCAYLVAFLPILLPDHPYITQEIFDEVINEVREDLKGCKSRTSRHEKMMKIGEQDLEKPHDECKISSKGARLAKELMQINEKEQIWKVLADFWADLIVFLAPSDNATAHAQRLANGGEFITHLWALLFHAGIVNREHSSAFAKLENQGSPV